jgi:TonB family protein
MAPTEVIVRCPTFLVAILLGAVARGQEPPPASVPLFSDDSLRGWVVEHAPRDGVAARGDTLLIKGPNAWIHTDRAKFKNFKLHFEIRTAVSRPQAILTILGESPTGSRPATALAIPLLAAAVAKADAFDRLRVRALVASGTGVTGALRPLSEWQTYDVVRRASELTVMLNGTVVLSDRAPTTLDGWIGFGVIDGVVEMRNIGVTDVAAPAILPGGVYLPGPGVTLPQLLKEVRPRYTSLAIQARVQGFTLLECVVGINGGVTDIQVIRSFDSKLGLDQEAINAASQWRFKPGTVDGKPVPVMVTIELNFTLKK